MKTSPLLSNQPFPAFKQIKPAHVYPALKKVIADNKAKIAAIAASNDAVSWAGFAEPLEEIHDQFDGFWSPVSHLEGVKDTAALRKAVEKSLPLLSAYASEIGQNHDLYNKYLSLAESAEFKQLSQAQQQSIHNEIRDFKLSGVALNEQDQARFKKINASLSKLCNQYQQNILDASEAWHLDIKDKALLSGLSQQSIDAAAQSAKEAKIEGWRFSLQAPSFVPFMAFADKRPLRREMYEAYVTRASEIGPNAAKFDNSELMQEIVSLRNEKASLLGFKHYADYSLQSKMAESVDQVEVFLLDLAKQCHTPAKKEWQALQDFAQKEAEHQGDLEAWDTAYYAEKLKAKTFDFSDEDLRPYFPLNKVLKGLFEVVHRLFGIQVIAAKAPEVWHKDVQFFEIIDHKNERRGWFYLDLYARKGKRGGAWMADCKNRRKTKEHLQHPIAFLNCNFAKPVGKQAALLRHDDVITLFHEFGHGLHHMLTQVDVSSVAGISGVPWDAVELPSQFLENWCWQREALDLISGHVDSGEPLPDVLLQKVLAAKYFHAALQMLRQIEFSLFDLRLHANDTANNIKPSSVDVQGVLDRVRQEVAVVKASEFNRFAHGFSHIFAGGYAAGYYSYKWAELLSADAFSRFEEEGVFNAETGQSFLENILEKGGSESPMVLFEQFRGRKPSIDALLKHSGLA